jgi:modulator of FtsH protease
MSFDLPTSATHYSDTTSQNQVLRQTYSLLAISLIPTVLGAAIGVYTDLNLVMRMSPIATMLAFFVGAWFFMYMIQKNSTTSKGVAWLLGFTFFMGLMLSRVIARTLGFSNGGELVMLAMGGTAGIFSAMAIGAGMIKRDLSMLGKGLMIASVVLMITGIASVFFNFSGFTLVWLAISLVLFSAYLLYDLAQIMQGGETNYIRATLAVYLDVYNIFSSLLSLLGLAGRRD